MEPSSMKKICLAGSIGGHLEELLQLQPVYQDYPHFYIVNDSLILPPAMEGRTYFIRHSERDLITLWNLWEAWRIFRRERPTHLVSTGAGLAVPLAIIARIFRTHVIFIESFCAICRPTLSGRIMYHLADTFGYQWEQLRRFYPKAEYAGKIFSFCNGRQRDAAV
jgi:beta-1,4-N-acetylglucosaminyltransferase